MRIKYPKAIQESEEELTRLEQRLRGQKTADRARMLRLLKSGTAKSLKDCAPMVGYSVSQLTRLPGTLSGRGFDRDTQAAQASRQGFAVDYRSVAGLVASDASGRHRHHARCAQLSRARVGHQLQERQVAVVALQETSGQVEDRAPTTQESQCRAAGRL